MGRLDAADVLTQARAGPEYLTARYLQLAEAAAGTDEDEQAVAEASAENAGDWDAYLAQCGSEWDGTEDSWPAFREWFAYHGETAGVATFAQAFLVYAEESGDKAAVFAEYGIAVPAAAAEDQEGAPEDVFAAGDLEALFAEDDTAEAPGDAALSAAVADAIEEAPELARMSDEDIAALIEGALADIAQQG